MALDLALTFIQENDNTGLQVTDNTGETATGTATGWGVVSGLAPNPATDLYTDIVASATTTAEKWHLKLDIVVTTSDGTETTYDQIDLYDLATTDGTTVPFAAVTDLVWVIDPANLISDGTAMGAVTDELVDGIYDITYTLADAPTDAVLEDVLETSILVDGKVRVKVYDVLRQISTVYNCTNEEEPVYTPEYRTILLSMLKYGMFRGMIANLSDGNTTEILNILDTLERLTIND